MLFSDEQFPLVTFVSPCYNHEKYVLQSLESIRDQTYPNIDHIIIDDASTDNSPYLIQKWIEENDYKCKYIRHTQNKGVSYTLNESIRLTKGNFWTPLATDDLIQPGRTEKFIDYLLKHSEIDMIVSDAKMINEEEKELKINGTSSFIKHYAQFNPLFNLENFGTFDTLIYGNYIPDSLMIRTKIFNDIGFFNEDLKVEDWDMWLRISAKYKIGLIDEYLSYYRWHQSNTVTNENSKKIIRRNILQTFLDQKTYCYTTGKREIFDEAYKFFFKSFFSPKHFSAIKMLLKGAHPFLIMKALAFKVKSIQERKAMN